VDFDWDAGNVAEIARHGLLPADVEQALNDPGQLGRPAYSRHGQRRAAMTGAAGKGRVLMAIITERGNRI